MGRRASQTVSLAPTSDKDEIDTYCTSGTSPTCDLDSVTSSTQQQSRTRTTTNRVFPTHYELVGSVELPTVVVLGGISAGRHICLTPNNQAPGWWGDVVGPHGPGIDTTLFSVLGIDWVGGPSHSTRHADVRVTTHDQATAIADVLDELNIEKIAAIVGASYGGMVALAFADLFPHRVDRVIAISAAHRTHPMATALRSLQRRIVRFGCQTGYEAEGLSLARGIAMTTYRTALEFADRFDIASLPEAGCRFPVEGYLENRGQAFSTAFTAESFTRLSESIDLHNVNPKNITVPLTLVSVTTDTLVPPWLIHELQQSVTGPVTLHEISSSYGHDAFLKEVPAISRIVREALEPSRVTNGASHVTRAVRASIDTDTQYGSVMPPLHLSANFSFRGLDEPRAHDYTRSGNPTRDALANAIAELEGGAGAVVTSSGMSAITVVLQLLKRGDRVLAPVDCYGGTRRLLDSLASQGRFTVHYAPLWDADRLADIVSGVHPTLIWVETPSNPLLRVTDLELVGRLARDQQALVVVDNTFLSPALQTPIDFGADVVVHSTTKFLNGHSDVVGGAVVSRKQDVADELQWWANCLGVTGAPFDSYLTLRGLRTLHARVNAHLRNAEAVVRRLLDDEEVAAVYHPSIPHHPGHVVAKRQQRGFGSIVSFSLGGGPRAVRKFVTGLQHFTLAESLGGVESLIAHPASMTHAAMTPEARVEAGISDSLLRLSVGIEDEKDLLADLDRALCRVRGSS